MMRTNFFTERSSFRILTSFLSLALFMLVGNTAFAGSHWRGVPYVFDGQENTGYYYGEDENGSFSENNRAATWYEVAEGTSSGTTTGHYYDYYGNDYVPTYINQSNDYHQILYPKESLVAGTISKISFYRASGGTASTSQDRKFTIWFKEYSTATISSWTSIKTGTVRKVVNAKTVTIPKGEGWIDITLDTPCPYSGNNNLVVCIYDHKGSSNNVTASFRAYNKGTNVHVRAAGGSAAYTDPTDGAPEQTGSASKWRPWARFAISPDIEVPEISLSSGTYTEPQSVTITCPTAGATIYYTTDGTTPTASSTEYTGAITVNNSPTTLKAIAEKSGSTSTVVSATYNFKALPPTFTNAGVHGEPVYATITAAEGCDIFYTTDGTAPTTSSTPYTEPFYVSSKTTVKAIAVPNSGFPYSGWSNSAVAEGDYLILKPNGMTPDQNPDGLVLNKSFTPTTADNNSGTITLEAFVTGSTIQVSDVVAPTDIVLVLDVSSSMISYQDIPETNGSSTMIRRMAAMESAVNHFLDLIAESGNQPDATAFPGQHHRVAFVTYGNSGRLWYNKTATPTYRIKTDTTNMSATNFDNAFYDVTGSTYKTAFGYIIDQFPGGDGNTELEYAMPIVKGLFDNNSDAISGSTVKRNRLVVVFTDGGIGGGRWGMIDGNPNFTAGSFYAEGKANYTLRRAFELKNTYNATFYSVGLFPSNTSTHYYPYVSNNIPAYNGISGATYDNGMYYWDEYSQKWAQNASRFMALRSSNYPFATSMTTTGSGSNNRGYFIVANDAESLQGAFATISTTVATPSVSLSAETVVEDVMSDAFMLPDGTTAADINVYTADYIDGSYNFGTEALFDDAHVSISGKRVCVSGFDFAEHWVGLNGTTPHGKKLIIKIPVERDYSTTPYGGTGIKTNADDSGVYGDDCDQVGAFISPTVSLDATTCFDFATVTPTAYNVPGSLPTGWTGYVTNTGTNIVAPHVVVANSEQGTIYPLMQTPSLLLITGNMTNAIAYAAMPAQQLSSEFNSIEFYYKTVSSYGVLEIGYLTAIPAVQDATNWASAFTSVATLQASTESEGGLFKIVDLSSVPTNVNVYITFKWYCEYSNLMSTYACCIDDLCLTYEEGIHLWTEAVTSLSDVPSGGFVVDGNGNITINCKEGLAWLISYVNGFNGSAAHNLSGKTVTLTADIDMSDYVWVPIGLNSTKPFMGSFDGQYHTIDGIHIADATEVGYVENSAVGTNGDMIYTGMFGYVAGYSASTISTIKNIFITSGTLSNRYYVDVNGNGIVDYYPESGAPDQGGWLGGLAGYVGNYTHIEFCETAVTLNALNNIFLMGGMIGELSATNSYIWACMSMSDLDCGSNAVYFVGGVAGNSTLNGVRPFSDCFANCTISANNANGKNAVALANVSKNIYAHPNSTGTTAVNGYPSESTYAVEGGGYSNVKTFSTSNYNYGVRNNLLTDMDKSLVDTLNDNVVSGYKWIRAAGSSINGGYPIVVPTAADSLACVSVDGKVLRFGELNAMINKYKNTAGAEIFMYNNDVITASFPSSSAADLYIDEKVALMQESSEVKAHVSITLDNSKGTAEMSRDWHMFSTPLQDVSLGITGYNQTASAPVYPNTSANDLVLGNNYEIDPYGYFPVGMTQSSDFDFYSFYETQYHWINLKRASNNHWHEDEIDGAHPQIHYYGQITDEGNEDELVPGKGYLVAVGNNTTANNNLMQAEGTLNRGVVTFDQVTSKASHLKGYNLLGNPYQSYLDFNLFADVNAEALWGTTSTSATGYKAYIVYDADIEYFDEYLVDNAYVGFSLGAAHSATRYLNMHQGFFIVRNDDSEFLSHAGDSVSVQFTEAMRSITATDVTFRDAQPTYPLVNLFCTDSEGKMETAVMEFERPLKAGSLKMKGLLNGKGVMYMRWDGDDLSNVFIDYMPDYVPVWFEAVEEGVFTITWNTANADFGYMHLIDHIAGVDYDCLAPGNDSYTFHATPDDMIARFRVVFKPLGIDEQEGENGENFAFFNGDELIVNGEGELSFIDVSGRVLATEHVSGQQSHIALPNVAEGLYVLRLSQTDGVRVQKIVIRK